ncbi:hypothetical protein RB195_002682 [Necator americanus]|uniref:Uncharacterized protein n=1 Tax=Necator americanus TaxID=51031 RepID=A0ABR1DK65_NECAM
MCQAVVCDSPSSVPTAVPTAKLQFERVRKYTATALVIRVVLTRLEISSLQGSTTKTTPQSAPPQIRGRVFGKSLKAMTLHDILRKIRTK